MRRKRGILLKYLAVVMQPSQAIMFNKNAILRREYIAEHHAAVVTKCVCAVYKFPNKALSCDIMYI